VVALVGLLNGCSRGQTKIEPEATPDVRIDLSVLEVRIEVFGRFRCGMVKQRRYSVSWQTGALRDTSAEKKARRGILSSGKRIRPQRCCRGFRKTFAGRSKAPPLICRGTLRSLRVTTVATMAAGMCLIEDRKRPS